MPPRIIEATPDAITQAAALLRDGQLVAFPTETVYGLGATALDGKAVAGIFAAKQRPSFNPLIIHVPDAQTAQKYVIWNDQAQNIAMRFWPGPLSMILPKRADCPVSDLASAGLDTLAIRVPAHPVAQKLLKEANLPIAAPSANKSGEISPTRPQHVVESLGDCVAMILAAGPCQVGLESTVIDLSGDTPKIARPGFVTAENLEESLGYKIGHDAGHDPQKPISPGQLLRHYAPTVPVRLNAVDVKKGEALLAFGALRFMGIEGGGHAKDLPDQSLRNLSEAGDLAEAAANLFAMLRALDRPEHTAIAVMSIPDKNVGIAINDRLRRAAQG